MSTTNPAPPSRTVSLWPATTTSAIVDTTVGDLLRAAAATVPDRVALVDGLPAPAPRRRWTYAEVLADAEKVAAALLARFSPGERVAVWESNRAEWVLLQMGAALAGIVLVTVNPNYRADELRYALRQSGSVGLVHGVEHRGLSMAEVVEAVRPDVPRLRETVSFADWDAFVATGERPPSFPTVTPDDPNLIIYTSGTTGFAKGALLHHRGVVNASRLSAERAGFCDGDAWINPIPLFHTGGGVLASIGTLARRGVHVVVPQFVPDLVLDLLESERGALILTVPTILLALLDKSGDRDLSALRTVMCGGAAVPADLVRRTKTQWGCDFSILFGQAEMHGVLTQTYPSDSDTDQAETLGQPMPAVEVKIADPVSGDPVAIGAEGEICARGYQNMVGYFDMPEATAATIDPEGWLHSGDVGTMDERGYLRISGRLKDLIIRGGENIHPLEVELVLLDHEKIADVAVIGIPDPHWGEQVAAVVQPADPAAPPLADDLAALCRSRLARFKAPRHWYVVDEFPRTPSGKVQKFVLRERAARDDLGRM
jgi:fatty-acyl-CoA synthase